MMISPRESGRPSGDWKPRNGTFWPKKPVTAVPPKQCVEDFVHRQHGAAELHEGFAEFEGPALGVMIRGFVIEQDVFEGVDA
nr:hypothetical protein [Arthrobacter liuii]